jgi:hypothetical protein
MTTPNNPQQPGPYGPPPGGQQPPPYAPQGGGQQAPPYPPPGGQQPPPYTPPGGQPPPYGQQPGSPPPAYPAAPTGQPAGGGGKKKIILGIIGIVVIGIVIAGVVYFQTKSPASAEAGDCIKVNSASTTSADVEKIDCTTQEAVYKVAKKLDNSGDDCPNEFYDKYTQSGSGDGFALCLMLNAKEGDCFGNITSTSGKTERTDCASAEAKVTKVVSGQADEAACPEGTGLPLVYPEPATTICLDPANA